MTREETIEKLKALIAKSPSGYIRKLKMDCNKELFAAMMMYLPDKVRADFYSLKTKIYWLVNGLTEFPKCIVCDKEMSDKQVKDIFKGYNRCCSTQCGKNSDRRKELYKATCLKKYGVENISQNAEVKKHKAEASLKKFGVSNPAQSKEVLDKMHATNLERYGVEHALQDKKFLDKAHETIKKLYGVRHAMQSRNIRIKAQARYKYQGINFDSKPELALYIYLKEALHKDFEYQPSHSFRYTFNEKDCFYQPDFFFDNHYYEIKGRHFFKEDGTMQNPYDHSLDPLYEAKHQCMLDNNVEILLDNDKMIYEAIAWIDQEYGKKHLDSFRSSNDNH